MKRLVRQTRETSITIGIARAASAMGGEVRVEITAGDARLVFFEHMLTALARYAGLELSLSARGDLRHHVMEDVALALGRAVLRVTPETAARYGERTVPMDDALVQAVIDVGGRAFFVGELPSRLYTHVLRSFSDALGATLHLRVLAGTDRHHVLEAAFKATGLALRQATSEGGAVFSTKGSVRWEEEG